MRIKECPFCGSTPDASLVLRRLGDGFEMAAVRCKSLSCHVKPRVASTMETGMALSSAIRRWNVRPKAD